MRSFYIHISIVFLIGTIACKQEATTVQEGANQNGQSQNAESADQEAAKPSDASAIEDMIIPF